MEMNYKIIKHQNSVILIADTFSDKVNIDKLWNSSTANDEYNIISNEKRKREILTVRHLLNEYLGRSVNIVHDENGKPFAENENISISISHCSSYVAIMIDYEKHSVGVDIEKSNRNVERVMRRFLSANEQEYMMKTKNPSHTMLLAWSAKETMYKVLGKKAFDFSGTLKVEVFEPEQCTEMNVTFVPESTTYTLQYQCNDHYVLVFGTDANKKQCL